MQQNGRYEFAVNMYLEFQVVYCSKLAFHLHDDKAPKNHTRRGKRSQRHNVCTVKILKFGTPQTIAIIVLIIVKFDVTLH